MSIENIELSHATNKTPTLIFSISALLFITGVAEATDVHRQSLLDECVISADASSTDLLDSYYLALENNSQLAAAKAATDANALSHDVFRAKYLYPNLTLDAQARRSTKPNERDSSKISSSNLTVTQTLWSESLGKGLKDSELEVELAALQYQKAQMDTYLVVVKSYFSVLAARDSVDTAKREIESIRTLLEHTEVRRNAGVGTETDVRTASARLALAEADAIEANSALESSYSTLSEVIGFLPCNLSILNESVAISTLSPNQAQHWIELAFENNVDLAIQKNAVTRSNLFIDLTNAESGFRAQFVGRLSDKFGGNAKLSNRSSLELVMSKSFSAGGLESKRRRQATLRHSSEIQKQKQLESQVLTRTRDAFRGVLNAIDRISALEVALVASESVLDITESNYDVGVVTSLAVLDAQQDLFEVRRDLHRARYAYLQSLAELELITGTLDLKGLERLNDFLL